MIVYVITFIAISVLHFFSWRVKYLRPTFLFISLFLLLLVSSMRDVTVGVDTRDYLDFFEYTRLNGLNLQEINVTKLFVPSGFEIGFKVYTYLISLISSSFVMYLFISSILIYLPVYLFIKRYSTNYYLSLVIYYCLFFFGSMSLLRQSIAMSIIILGTKFIVNRNPIKYLAIVLLASSFHISALIVIILYPVYNKSLSKFSATMTLFLAALVFGFMGALVKFVATVNPRYEFYLDRINSFSLASYLAFGLYLLILFILITLYDKSVVARKFAINYSFLIITSFLAMVIMGLSIKVNSLDRLSLLFLIYTVISIPIFMSTSKNFKYVRFLKVGLVSIFVAHASVTLLIKPEWYGVTDYKVNVDLLRNQ